MRTYLRLLKYLRPYRARFTVAVGCMVVYALMTALALGMMGPFMQVLFERSGQDTVQSLALPGHSTPARMMELSREPLRADNLARWPELVKARAERSLVMARPLVALERICLFILVVL